MTDLDLAKVHDLASQATAAAIEVGFCIGVRADEETHRSAELAANAAWEAFGDALWSLGEKDSGDSA